jgi:protein-L-isoaspartate(D-aspartate) O-methyltransferase
MSAEGKVKLLLALRRAGVTDTRVLSAIESLPREPFVPLPFRHAAYDDVALPIGHGQTLSRPAVVALMTECLDLGPRMKVLEIGTGSGYQTSVLSLLARRVYTVERHRPLLAAAEKRFAELKLFNMVTLAADGTLGWKAQAPFQRIIVTAAAPDVPPVLADQLAEGGWMVCPVGADHASQKCVRVTRENGGFTTKELRAMPFVPLVPAMGLPLGALPEAV